MDFPQLVGLPQQTIYKNTKEKNDLSKLFEEDYQMKTPISSNCTSYDRLIGLKQFCFFVDSEETLPCQQQLAKSTYCFYSCCIRVREFDQQTFEKTITAMSQHRFITNVNIKNAKVRDFGIQLKFIKIAKFQNNQISESGVKQIVKCNWKYLQLLSLSNNRIGNKGMYWLAKGNWSYLKYLYLENCGLSTCGMRYFSRGQFNKLKYLNISRLNSLETPRLKNLVISLPTQIRNYRGRLKLKMPWLKIISVNSMSVQIINFNNMHAQYPQISDDQ